MTCKGKGHSAPMSARIVRGDKQASFEGIGSAEAGAGYVEKPEQVLFPSSSSGYTSDPTSTRRSTKAQPAHLNYLPRSHGQPDGGYKTMPQPAMSVVLPTHVSSSGLYGEMGFGQLYLQNAPTIYHRSQTNPMNSSRLVYSPGMIHSYNRNPAMVQSQNSLHAVTSTNTTLSSVIYQGGAAPTQQVRVLEKSAVHNGNENNSQSQQQSSTETCTHRNPQLVSMANSSSSAVTYTTITATASTSRPLSCKSCGCMGHNNVQPAHGNIQYVPPIYNNTVVTVPTQFTPYLVQPGINGLAPEPVNMAMLGMAHPGTHGVINVPNCGHSNFNNFASPVGGHCQRKFKKVNCHNCGSSKHSASDCTERSMEALSGQLNFG